MKLQHAYSAKYSSYIIKSVTTLNCWLQDFYEPFYLSFHLIHVIRIERHAFIFFCEKNTSRQHNYIANTRGGNEFVTFSLLYKIERKHENIKHVIPYIFSYAYNTAIY